jgi:hypothetical protein
MSIITRQKGKEFYRKWNKNFDPSYNIRINDSFQTTLSGVRHNGCEETILMNEKKLKRGTEVLLVPDPENKYDKTATKVCMKTGKMLGWLPNQDWNDRIFIDLMNGKKWEASVEEITQPSREFNNYNLLINIQELSKAE